MKTVKVNHKRIRAEVIKEHLGEKRAFAFSCGNATRWLARAGVNLIAIDGLELEAKHYIEPKKAEHYFNAFNATSGCLPTFLMERIADHITKEINHNKPAEHGKIYAPFGSGELIVALGYLHPLHQIVAVTSNDFAPTFQDGTSPLTALVGKNCRILDVNGARNVAALEEAARQQATAADIFINTSEAEN
ncbi:hypothetical protein HY504_02700 [Candidatus Wolfebacteria bacterium]|nr:hypothetical protein [Candidatus Wolfebacteria bacterium]